MVNTAGDLPWLPQLAGKAADVSDGLQDDVQLGHIVLDAHTRDQALQSEIRKWVVIENFQWTVLLEEEKCCPFKKYVTVSPKI